MHYFFCLFFGIFVFFSSQSWALSVDDLRFGSHPDKVRMVLELDEVVDFRVFTLNSPERLVIDLPAFDWRIQNISPAGPVQDVRQGHLQPGISRVVIDLSYSVEVLSAFLLPAAQGKPNRLVVDFRKGNDGDGKIFGSLETKATPYKGTNVNLNQPPVQQSKPKQNKPLIIIDAGHGGVDPGAVSGRILEKNIALDASIELRRQLEATGRYRVKMTREKDVFLKLHERVRFARRHEGDLFISVHADSINKPGVRGASIYTLSNTASDAQTARLAARENRADLIAGVDLTHEDQDVANILIDLAMRDTMNQSKFFANLVVEEMRRENIKLLTKPHRFAGFAVLKAPDMPSVLFEIGFLSNRNEAQLLSNPNHRRRIMSSLVKGIDSYFQKVARNQQN